MKKQIILLADGDEASRLLIRQYLQGYPEFLIAGECSNGPETLRSINSLEPDLVMMETSLPGKDGFKVLEESGFQPEVIFSAAGERHAARAFDYHAVDYLVKPYSEDRFAAAMGKYKKLKAVPSPADKCPLTVYPKKIFVDWGKGLKCIAMSEISYLRAERDNTWIHTVRNESYLSSFGIGHIEKKLDPAVFIRIHRSYIVNIEHIQAMQRDITKTFIALQNDVELNVGRNYYEQVRQLIF